MQKLISYLRSKYLYIYILTLPFAYANAIFPAAIQASGGWIVEHTPALRIVAMIIFAAVVGYFVLAKLAVYNQKVLSVCVLYGRIKSEAGPYAANAQRQGDGSEQLRSIK